MFGAILQAKNSSFQKGMTFCRSIYVTKVMKLLAFRFEQPSYMTPVYDVSIRHLQVIYLKPKKTQLVQVLFFL